MKIATALPYRASSRSLACPQLSQAETTKISAQEDLSELRLDNPLLSRTLDCSHALLDLAEGGLEWSDHPGMKL